MSMEAKYHEQRPPRASWVQQVMMNPAVCSTFLRDIQPPFFLPCDAEQTTEQEGRVCSGVSSCWRRQVLPPLATSEISWRRAPEPREVLKQMFPLVLQKTVSAPLQTMLGNEAGPSGISSCAWLNCLLLPLCASVSVNNSAILSNDLKNSMLFSFGEVRF